MLFNLLGSLLAFTSLIAVDATLPIFTWSIDKASAHGVPYLQIKFPDGNQDDVVLLQQFNPIPIASHESRFDIDHCIFEGWLQNESDVYVTLTGGCPFDNNFEIQFRSKRLKDYMFKVVNGVVLALKSPFQKSEENRLNEIAETVTDVALTIPNTKKDHPPITPKDGSQPKDFQDHPPITPKDGSARVAFPLTGLVMNVAMYYDQTFKAKYVTATESVDAMRRVVAHAQNLFYLPSLTTRIRLNVVKEQEIAESIEADITNLTMVGKYPTDATIHENAFLSFQNNQSGFVGIGWIGSSCYSGLQYRTTISEWYYSDLETGQILAHEIGHNLGMYHDFIDPNVTSARYDRNGNSCKNIGGVMDYNDNVTKWSTCSVEDFQDYYNYFVPFCMGAETATTTTTTVTSTSTSTTSRTSTFTATTTKTSTTTTRGSSSTSKTTKPTSTSTSTTKRTSTSTSKATTKPTPTSTSTTKRTSTSTSKTTTKPTSTSKSATTTTRPKSTSTTKTTARPTSTTTTKKPTSICKCGVANNRIVGGFIAAPHAYPYQVGILAANGTAPFCGGSLVSPNYVLTAAHCVTESRVSPARVSIGDVNFEIMGDGEIYNNIQSIVVHPSYNSTTADNDFALIKLSSPVKVSQNASIICLPPDVSQTFAGTNLTISGWGRTTFNGTRSPALKAAFITGMTNSDCSATGYGSEITDNMICATTPAIDTDTCQGDSGGPMAATLNGKFTVVGVTSFGVGCAEPPFPGVYARVTAQKTWILSNSDAGLCQN